MIELLIVADDITGALDTGVQLVKQHIPVRILTDPSDGCWDTPGYPVLVLAPETRHLSPADAYRLVSGIFQHARTLAIPFLYKKTDSALRGNIGAELQAMADVYPEESLCFVPAFPAAGRSTKSGVHYIDGTPVASSAFGQDPFSPVEESYVPSWLARRGLRQRCLSVECGQLPSVMEKGDILVFDAEIEEDLDQITGFVEQNSVRLLAGCAGFAAYLPRLIRRYGAPPEARRDLQHDMQRDPQRDLQRDLQRELQHDLQRDLQRELQHDLPDERHSLPDRQRFSLSAKDKPMIVFSGSLNRITGDQIRAAVAKGFTAIPITDSMLFQADSENLPDSLFADIRSKADLIFSPSQAKPSDPALAQPSSAYASGLGLLAKQIYECCRDRHWMIVGGDTLMAFLRAMRMESLIPLCEIESGVVLAGSLPGGFVFIAKSGGLGAIDVFADAKAWITAR
ncbi:MAG: four-carbon acid sugar kinase family protein [Clostridiales bacterium]|nr:four-carbon acid sugar kinase family protein [Clostridiales bacterium]